MSLITGVAVTWVPSAKMACLTAVPSGSQCKCEVTLWHLGIHAQERFHGCMHWCTAGTLTYAHGHAHTYTHTCLYWLLGHTSCRHKHSPQSSNSCQSALTPLWKEHALIQGVLIILLRFLWVIHPGYCCPENFYRETGSWKSKASEDKATLRAFN